MQMLKKLFNSNSKFYLELDEIKDSEVVQTAVKTASKAADTVKEKASDVADTAQDKLASAVGTEEKPAEVKSTEAETKAKAETTAKAKTKAKTKSSEEKKAPAIESKASKNGKADAPQEATPASTNTGASSYEPPFWVAAMSNTNNSTNSNGRVAEQTFATDNLMPTPTKFRRRPGGSLDKFKNMAKQAKTPKG